MWILFICLYVLGKELTNRPGYFDPGQQAICVEAT